jgi:tRNA-dihydrouridine synthase B
MGRLIRTIKENSNKRYTSAKIRIGFDTKKGVEIAQMCEASGADFIAVHGRTRSGKFEAPVDYDEIARIKEAVNIPVIANGDITSYEKAQEVLAHTKANGVMIGRGAVGAPWLFYQLKHGQSEVDPAVRREIVLEHFNAMIDFHNEFGVKLFRKHLHTYTKGMAEGATFRDMINRMDESVSVREAIESFF